jgi:tRNA pseudouridine32 synthase/23S rRNA pseudouridine746 synthase
MSTSGIMILARNKEVHQFLQRQFITRRIHKRYVAVLEGIWGGNSSGEIHLPLRVDLDNRPRQLVCYEYGKPSATKFDIVSVQNNSTRIYFYPVTGRTHQLRVHASHPEGLNLPIKGDDLYGTKQDRLYLHADTIEFIHPLTREKMTIHCEPDF